jgi:hypothetical protein
MNKVNSGKRRVLFHRSWTIFNGGTSGGQIKVRDAFEHFKQSNIFEPKVYFGKNTQWFDNPGNVWLPYREGSVQNWKLDESDILFFAGVDWEVLNEKERKNPIVPIINIAQPRHINPEDKRNGYLKNPAIRIAKSSIGKKILEDYGVNGPVYLIPDAIDFNKLPEPNSDTDIDVLIVGLKNEKMARSLERRLNRKFRFTFKKFKIAIQVPPKLPTRMDFINLLNRCEIAVFLPLDASRGAEGFYLPALEGMRLNKLVICPYAVGNIDFCIPDKTCLQPKYTESAIYNSILKALEMPKHLKDEMIKNAKIISENHNIDKERESLLNLLHNADEIWNTKNLFWS